MRKQVSPFQLLSVLQFCDSTFPIGAFTLSNGLETQVQKGYLKTAADLKDWCLDYLKLLPYNELGAAVLAWRAADSERDIQRLDSIASCARGPRELREGSRKLCLRLIRMQERITNNPHLDHYAALIKEKKAYGSFGVAAGLLIRDILTGDQGTDTKEIFCIFCYSLLSPMVTNAVKLVPLSQMDGQRVLYELFPCIENAVEAAFLVSSEELGFSGAGFDICSMEHEVLYSRVYIS